MKRHDAEAASLKLAETRIATHRLLPSYVKNAYSTDPAHMPDSLCLVKPRFRF